MTEAERVVESILAASISERYEGAVEGEDGRLVPNLIVVERRTGKGSDGLDVLAHEMGVWGGVLVLGWYYDEVFAEGFEVALEPGGQIRTGTGVPILAQSAYPDLSVEEFCCLQQRFLAGMEQAAKLFLHTHCRCGCPCGCREVGVSMTGDGTGVRCLECGDGVEDEGEWIGCRRTL